MCIDAAHQMVLFADLLGEMPAQLAGKKSRQPRAPDMPKYPKSSYILFSDDHRQETRKETKSGKASDVVTLLAQKWNALSDAEKQVCTTCGVPRCDLDHFHSPTSSRPRKKGNAMKWRWRHTAQSWPPRV